MEDYIVVVERVRTAQRALVINAKSPDDAERKVEAALCEGNEPFGPKELGIMFKDQHENYFCRAIDYVREKGKL